MKSKIKIAACLLLAALLCVFSLAPAFFAVYASGGQAFTITAEKTDIKADSVYNRSGYGIVTFNGPFEDGQPGNDWPWYGLVGPDGKYVIAAKPKYLSPKHDTTGDEFYITDGIICDVGKGYYNLDGSVAFDPYVYKGAVQGEPHISEVQAMPFYNGRALIMYIIEGVYWQDGQGLSDIEIGPICLVDKKGNIVKQTARPQGDYPEPLYWGGEGFTCRTNFTDAAVYYDYDGNVKIDLAGRGYGPFTGLFFEGRAWVRNASTKLCGFIDTTGKEVIPCEYDEVAGFCDGLAIVKRNGKYGYINKNNEIVIPIEYDSAFGAGGGLACVGNGGKYGYVDYKNNIVLPFEYDDLSSFEGEVGYGIKGGELYVLKKAPAAAGFPVVPVAAGTAVVAGLGTVAFILIKHAGAAAAVKAAAAAAASAAAAAGAEAASGAAEAAGEELAAKGASKLGKIKFGSRTVLISSKDEKLTEFLKNKAFLKVRTCPFGELERAAKEAGADLLIADIDSDSSLDELLGKEGLKETALGLILSDGVSGEARNRLEELKNGGAAINYIDKGESPFLTMVDLVLPVLSPDVKTDASLSNIGTVADALGIPGISAVVELFTAGRDIKSNLQKNEEEIGIGETAAVIGDIAAILGLGELKSVAGLVGDVKAVKESMDKEAGAYEGRQGVSAAKDIIDTVTNLK